MEEKQAVDFITVDRFNRSQRNTRQPGCSRKETVHAWWVVNFVSLRMTEKYPLMQGFWNFFAGVPLNEI
jgi:hypothetical protein